MTSTLSFTLPEENEKYTAAVQGAVWKAVVEDLAAEMRAVIKYNADAKTTDEWYTRLFEIVGEHGLEVG